MQRILKGQPATISATFLDSATEVPVDPSPDSATVRVLRADGTELVASSAATNAAGTGKFTFLLTPTHTAQLDLLTARWTATVAGVVTTIETSAEVVGAFLFTVAEARALAPLSNTTKYPTESIIAARAVAEDALEDTCNVAFVSRYRLQELEVPTMSNRLRLDRWEAQRIRSVTVDGEALTADQLSALRIYNGRSADSVSYIFLPRTTIAVGYEHGHRVAPAGAGRAALLIARELLVEHGVDPRATSITTDAGTVRLGSGIPEVDAFVGRQGRPEASFL